MSRHSDRPRIFYTGIALLGLATGLRSQLGVAVVGACVPARSLPKILRPRAVRRGLTATALSELVIDKLPLTPDRTQPPGLIARVALGGAAGGLAARSMGLNVGKPARAGAFAATASTFLGLAARRSLSRRISPSAAALAEDLAALCLAVAGIRIARS